MTKAFIRFTRFVQDSQEYGSDDEHMVSPVFFDMHVGDKAYNGLFSNVKQVVGASFETDPFEVSAPAGYAGPFNYNAFCEITEAYIRGLVGVSGSGIRITGGAKGVRMYNNTFVKTQAVTIDIPA